MLSEKSKAVIASIKSTFRKMEGIIDSVAKKGEHSLETLQLYKLNYHMKEYLGVLKDTKNTNEIMELIESNAYEEFSEHLQRSVTKQKYKEDYGQHLDNNSDGLSNLFGESE
jgi:hypothetical protein